MCIPTNRRLTLSSSTSPTQHSFHTWVRKHAIHKRRWRFVLWRIFWIISRRARVVTSFLNMPYKPGYSRQNRKAEDQGAIDINHVALDPPLKCIELHVVISLRSDHRGDQNSNKEINHVVLSFVGSNPNLH